MVKASIVNTDPPNLPKEMGLLVVVVYSVRCSCLCLPGVVAGRQLMVFPPPGCVYGWRAGGGGGGCGCEAASGREEAVCQASFAS